MEISVADFVRFSCAINVFLEQRLGARLFIGSILTFP